MSSGEPSPWRWQHAAAILFIIVHVMAMLQSARPVNLLYPPAEESSGLQTLRTLEQLTRRAPASKDHPSTPLQTYIRLLGIEQQWNTFAPVPPRSYSHHVVTARTALGEQTLWDDGLPLNRSGVGFYYNPTVKLISNFRSRAFQDLFVRGRAEEFYRASGIRPVSVLLRASMITIAVDAAGRITKSPPRHLVLRTVNVAAP